MLKKLNLVIKVLVGCIIFLSLLTHNFQIGILAVLVLVLDRLEEINDSIKELKKEE